MATVRRIIQGIEEPFMIIEFSEEEAKMLRTFTGNNVVGSGQSPFRIMTSSIWEQLCEIPELENSPRLRVASNLVLLN